MSKYYGKPYTFIYSDDWHSIHIAQINTNGYSPEKEFQGFILRTYGEYDHTDHDSSRYHLIYTIKGHIEKHEGFLRKMTKKEMEEVITEQDLV